MSAKKKYISPWPNWEIRESIAKNNYGEIFKIVRLDHKNIVAYSAVKVIEIPSNQEEIDEIMMEMVWMKDVNLMISKIAEDAKKEIRALQSLKGHPNIIHIEDYQDVVTEDDEGVQKHTLFIRMEMLESLPKIMSESETLQMGIDICSALDAVESLRTEDGKRVYHRDVTPDNILISRSHSRTIYKLSYFGSGKTGYLAPEVYLKGQASPTIDIYSLAISMYVKTNDGCLPFLTKETKNGPFERRDAEEKRLSGKTSIPAPANASPELAEVILKALSYKPEDRFQSAKEMLEALESCHASSTQSK